jgi:hypothetical protein
VTRKSLFEELNEFAPVTSKEVIIENRANHAIASMINLIEYIEENFSEDDAVNLQRRLISSIKGKDPKRFARALNKVTRTHVNEDGGEET